MNKAIKKNQTNKKIKKIKAKILIEFNKFIKIKLNTNN